MAPPTADHRPLTGDTSPPLRQIILSLPPVGLEEHLVHGWDALQRVREGDRAAETLAYVHQRARSARALAASLGEHSPRRKLAFAEIEALVEEAVDFHEDASETGLSFEEAVKVHVLEPLRSALGAARSPQGPCAAGAARASSGEPRA